MAPGRVLEPAEIADRALRWPVAERRVLARGAICDFVDDRIETPAGGHVARQFTTHPGAVGIIAWNDNDQIAVVRQYRHPVGFELIEPPAGLLDHADEDYLEAAKRELAEEVGLAANCWQVLVDVFSSPGANAESIRVYLATGIQPAPVPDGFEPDAEEAEMEACWAARADLVAAIFSGRVQNPTLVDGVLALETARLSGGLDSLRPADAPWEARVTWRKHGLGVRG
ncbi:MAG: NUDIX hydrolase [Propionibacteriaceae bacterium]|jgi:ADP-ribose pyrophosphatase|nr:NUDIX hydrolase [Propionibacteriaceae bacterium]